jgi:hypothetical protein
VTAPFYRTPERCPNNGELSPVRESQELRLGLRAVLWVRWRGIGGKSGFKRGAGLFIWRGGLGDRQERSWCPGQVVARMGSGVSVQGRGVRGEQAFGGMCASRGADTVVPTVRSHLRAQVFDGGLGGLTGKRW